VILLAVEVQGSTRTPRTSSTVATRAKQVARRLHQRNQKGSRRHIKGRRSTDWKLVDYVFDPSYVRFDVTMEGCVDIEGRNSYGDLPHCSPSDSILEIYLIGEKVLLNPPWELAEHIAQHFKKCRGTTPTSSLAVFFCLLE
jgi:hypothetical protein